MRWDLISPLIVTWCALTEVFSQWYRSKDIDYSEGELLEPRWVQWGTCRSSNHRHASDFRYFVLRLPSYEWIKDPWREHSSWGQLALLRFNGKWRRTYFEVQR